MNFEDGIREGKANDQAEVNELNFLLAPEETRRESTRCASRS